MEDESPTLRKRKEKPTELMPYFNGSNSTVSLEMKLLLIVFKLLYDCKQSLVVSVESLLFFGKFLISQFCLKIDNRWG